jgi:hypothetical protein
VEQTRSQNRHEDWWDRIWRDKRGNIVIFQWPNVWLIAWAILDIISIVTMGTVSNIFWWLANATLAVWALLEVTKGVNYFRRGLGVIVLILLILSVFKVGY